ncbi:MAG: T9SS type A sorting domain-containing protein, partial [Candidatus Eisenbacteria bacterium]|nr:T9SS type A sorting domain-containing protein [Candidatus Eisenbacteria bacterium]
LASPESDLGRYELHRGTDPFFTPSEATQLATLTGTEYMDGQTPGTAVYKLAAVDVHGNRGAFATLLANQVTGVGDGDRPVLALSAPSPNPSHGSLEFAFSLPSEGHARLHILDAQGRVVRTLLDGTRPAGRTSLRWDGRDASGRHAGAGLYWVRLETAGGSRVQRFARID